MTISIDTVITQIEFSDINPIFDADERLILNSIVKHLENTIEDSWCVDVYRSTDGKKNCVLAHIFSMMDNDEDSAAFMERFEYVWGNSYTIGLRANDGKDPENYPQETPKARSIAYITNLMNGLEDSAIITMERDYEYSMSQH